MILYCFSRKEKKDYFDSKGWLDPDTFPQDCASIEITGTQDCKECLEMTDDDPYFKDSHDNILNLVFDDIGEPELEYKGKKILGITKEQARECVEFIEKNLGKNFYINCRAGKSRSQAIVRFILDMYPEIDWETRDDNPCTTPNIFVLSELKRAYYDNYGFSTEV